MYFLSVSGEEAVASNWQTSEKWKKIKEGRKEGVNQQEIRAIPLGQFETKI